LPTPPFWLAIAKIVPTWPKVAVEAVRNSTSP
jgi:hypothetical protein